MTSKLKEVLSFCYACVTMLSFALCQVLPFLFMGGLIVGFVYMLNASEVSLGQYEKIEQWKIEITDKKWQALLREYLEDKKISHHELNKLESLTHNIHKEAVISKLNVQ